MNASHTPLQTRLKQSQATSQRSRRERRAVHGILLLDKPTGMTSNVALQRAKRCYQAAKAGHAGSLDPMASGMLPIFFGDYTRFSQYLLEADKHYQVVMRLGVTTDSGDASGQVIERREFKTVRLEDLNKVVAKFAAGYMQTPPMHSAIKQQGQRLYVLARQGVSVPRKARAVTFSRLVITDYYNGLLQLEVGCSKGTYIRSLAEDIGAELGCGAHVAMLRRTAVGGFAAGSMHSLAGLQCQAADYGYAQQRCLLSLNGLLSHLPSLALDDVALKRLHLGQRLAAAEVLAAQPNIRPGMIQITNLHHETVGVGEVQATSSLHVLRLLRHAVSI